MLVLDRTLPTLAENLALDEALLLEAEADGPEWLRFWEWSAPAVIVGAGGRVAEDVKESACRVDNVPIVRRSSGGGTVLLGPGSLLFTLVLSIQRAPELTEIVSSYRFILGALADALANLVPGVAVAGTSDLVLGDRKISGNSQQRKRRHLLHHGTLLYGFAPEPVERYLHLPARQPEYRQQRGHVDFLGNLPLPAAHIKKCLQCVWQPTEFAMDWPRQTVDRLVAEKYSQREWIRRR
jgi:lipoate-protein ligase A